MINQENVTLIVCVCKLAEGGRSKCHQYWPDVSQQFEEFKVTLVSENALSTNLIERVLEVRGATKTF